MFREVLPVLPEYTDCFLWDALVVRENSGRYTGRQALMMPTEISTCDQTAPGEAVPIQLSYKTNWK